MSSTETPKKGLLERWFGAGTTVPDQPPTAEEIQAWLVERLAGYLEMDPAAINVRENFSNYGLDSRTAVGLSGDLERWLGRRLVATLVWDYPTIELVAKHLAGGSEQATDDSGNNQEPIAGQAVESPQEG